MLAQGKLFSVGFNIKGYVGVRNDILAINTSFTFFFIILALGSLKDIKQIQQLCCFVSQVLLYDLRSNQPLLVKDHFYSLPIKSLHFHDKLDLIVSADSKIIKIWNKDTVRISKSHYRTCFTYTCRSHILVFGMFCFCFHNSMQLSWHGLHKFMKPLMTHVIPECIDSVSESF